MKNLETIETGRLVLRKMTLADAPDVMDFCSRQQTAYWAGMEPMRQIADAEDVISWGNVFEDDLQYGITEKGSDRVVGILGAEVDYREGEMLYVLGYLISPEVEGRGFMTESVTSLCERLFENTPVDRIMCEIRPDNIPSRRVAAKCGFLQDPCQRHWRLNLYGKPLDEFFLERRAS